MSHKPKVLLAVLDGWGINKDYPGNAISQAKTPFLTDFGKNILIPNLMLLAKMWAYPLGRWGLQR